jgi:DNA repair protein RadC
MPSFSYTTTLVEMPPLATRTHAVSLAATTMQIQLLDHLIMGAPADGRAGYFSFKEAGLL